MEYVGLGRTGLRVSVAGLGCGGFSRLGLGSGQERGRDRRADPSGPRPRGQPVRHGRRLWHRSRARQGARGGPARGGRDRDQSAVQCQQPELECRQRRRLARRLVAPACHRRYRRLSAARRGTCRLRPRAKRHRTGLAEGKSQRQVPSPRHYRDRTARSRAQDVAACRGRRCVGCRNGRLSHDASKCAQGGIAADPTILGSGHC